ncbi:MAG: TolC family protein [Planctomycetota bacterium]
MIIAGCSGKPIPSERNARDDLAVVASRFQISELQPELPLLTADSRIEDYLTFAMLNSPKIRYAYYEWAASIERITTARSRPDPKLMFRADIASMVMSAVAGLMIDLPGPGKLRIAGDIAAAESQGRYYTFEMETLRVAYAVKNAYYRLQFLEDNIRVQRETLRLLGEIETLARQQNAAGRVMLQDVLRAQIEQEQVKTRIENLEDSRSALLAELKAALGLRADETDPPVPAKFTSSGESLDSEKILDIALASNPVIKKMASDVRRAQGLIDLARKAGVPDFSVGVEANFIASPMSWMPSASLTLPIWRDKIAAQIAAGQAEKRAAEARLSDEQIQLAAELAAMLYVFRENVRNAELLEERLIPKGRQSLDIARTGYANNKSGFLDVIESHRLLLSFDLSLIDARVQKELALASISLLIVGASPQGSPLPRSAELSGSAGQKEVSQ